MNPNAADYYFSVGECSECHHLRKILDPGMPQLAPPMERFPREVLQNLPPHERIFFAVNELHKKGVYSGLVCDRDLLLPSGEPGYSVATVGESKDIPVTLSDPGELVEIDGVATGGVELMWYAFVDGSGRNGKARRRALEKKVRIQMERLKLRLAATIDASREDEFYQLRLDLIPLAYNTYIQAVEEWLAAKGGTIIVTKMKTKRKVRRQSVVAESVVDGRLVLEVQSSEEELVSSDSESEPEAPIVIEDRSTPAEPGSPIVTEAHSMPAQPAVRRRTTICTAEGCDSKARAHGLCWKHGGKTICKVAGCSNGARRDGLCHGHKDLG